MRWPLSGFSARRQRHAKQAQVAAEAHQEAERQAALQRLLDVARRDTGPEWHATKPWRSNAGHYP